MKVKLQKQLKLANQILTLAELARKAETEHEKVRTRGNGREELDGILRDHYPPRALRIA